MECGRRAMIPIQDKVTSKAGAIEVGEEKPARMNVCFRISVVLLETRGQG